MNKIIKNRIIKSGVASLLLAGFVFLSAPVDATPVFGETEIASFPAKGEKFIGYRHKGVVRGAKLPNGVEDLGGGLLSSEDYGVTRFAQGKKYMLWLEKIVEIDADGVPHWEVKDVLIFDKPKKNQEFFFSYSSPCTINGAENLDLIVRAEVQPKKRAYKIIQAWLANVETEKFEAAPIENIACEF